MVEMKVDETAEKMEEQTDAKAVQMAALMAAWKVVMMDLHIQLQLE